MTTEQKRIKIAEACGWRREWVNQERHIQQWVCRRPDGSVDYCDPDPNAGWEAHRLPDYFTDLNAMHAAEEVLGPEQWEQYVFWLSHICPLGTYIRAKAAQRAEAFGKTLGLWP